MRKILVADDEKVVRDVITRFLELKGYDVCTAEDGQETINKVIADNFDLLIMDLRMPGLNAQEMLAQLGKIKKELPIIILTGTIDTDRLGILRELGYSNNDIICKPADLFEILKKIKAKLPDE
jgi:DNA-binding response OmpR family regulator